MSGFRTRQAYDAWATRLCEGDYSKHEVVQGQLAPGQRAPGLSSWLLRRPDRSNLWARLIITDAALIVTGDGPDLILRGGPSEALARLAWVATSGAEYLRQKLVAGPWNSVGLGHDWEDGIAVTELAEHLDPEAPGLCDVGQVLATWRGGLYEEWLQLLAEHLEQPGEYSTAGRVVALCVYQLRALCRRLVAVLDSQTDGQP